MLRDRAKLFVACASVAMAVGHENPNSWAHEGTLPAAVKREQAARQSLLAQAQVDNQTKQQLGTCHLTITLIDADTEQPLAGNIHITDTPAGNSLALTELVSRPNQWFAMFATAVVAVPQTQLTIAAFHGIETELAEREINLEGRPTATVRLPLKRFYRAHDHQLVSGNTHLHLNRISRADADRYLQVVPAADDLDLLYVSHLRRAIDDESYTTNGYDAESLAQLSRPPVLLRYGQEHRHNFEAYGEGYGHVMFLDIQRLIEPISIGPGLMRQGTDGIPLRQGIDQARKDGATVIWCHNNFGVEDLPNWMSGVLDAQNIFDGGEHGTYKDTYYRYLNVGLKVPFSTGTDWFVYDLSRVLVPLDTPKSSPAWLKQLAAGRSYITNGPLLEFGAGTYVIGDTIKCDQPATIHVSGHALGRNDFRGLELVQNGQVIDTARSERVEHHYEATLATDVRVDRPGWLALRVPLDAGKNEFDQVLFAHTSPIYIEFAGKHIFQRDTAQELLVEMERNISIIKHKGVFGSPAEQEAVLRVHRAGIAALQEGVRSEE